MEYQLKNGNCLRPIIRLKKIEFTNFRNIGKSSITFPGSDCKDVQKGAPSILGLYGQNGSGKTSVIMALSILKSLLMEEPIDSRYSSCIRCGYDRCTLSFTFGSYLCSDIDDEEIVEAQQTETFYSFDLVNKPNKVLLPDNVVVPKGKIFVENEVIQVRQYKMDGTILKPKQVLIDTRVTHSNIKGYAFGNATKYSRYVGDSTSVKEALIALKQKKYIEGKSFAFCAELQNSICSDSLLDNIEDTMILIARAVEFFKWYGGFDEEWVRELELGCKPYKNKAEPLFNHRQNELGEKERAGLLSNNLENPEVHELNYYYINKLMELIHEQDELLTKIDPEHKAWASARAYTMDDIIDDRLREIFSSALPEFQKRHIEIENLFLQYQCGNVLGMLAWYGEYCLYIVDTTITGQTNMNSTLPLLLWEYSQKGNEIKIDAECIDLNMDEKTGVPIDKFVLVEKSIESINTVLEELIPDIKLGFEDLGISTDADGHERHYFDIQSIRRNIQIPLKYESDGVRRIVSLMSLFIAVYNEPSFTMAIDEIDSGIFEYLLGELFQVLAESAQGQFIFTSHNLRPLEVLPAKYLCFTSVNPNHRFVKLSNRGNSNLRDTYFRMIILGSDSDAVYQSTDRYRIQRAFYRACPGGDSE